MTRLKKVGAVFSLIGQAYVFIRMSIWLDGCIDYYFGWRAWPQIPGYWIATALFGSACMAVNIMCKQVKEFAA